ncbi:amidohydrolase family protein [Streptosporangium sp. NPDC051022]|uniref:metal-dependent hydrolase family protein n=1 Tax=Streptosporangium sp. NPDC051022 TaxID=3155752 RepID=UPI00341B3AF2
MSRLVLRGARVFDGTGAHPYAADVAVENGRFAEVGTAPAGDTVADVTGLTLLPGLINCHVHVVGCAPTLEERLRTPFSYQFYAALPILDHLLRSGFTTVRDLAGADAGLKLAVDRGIVRGPRLRIAIEALSPTGGHIDAHLPSGLPAFEYYLPHPGRPHGVVDGPEEIRRLVRELIRGGADCVKVCTTDGGTWPRKDHLPAHFRDDELAAVMEEARNAGLHVASHAHGAAGAANAARAGVDSIEHGTYLDQETVDLMAERGTWFVPTLVRTFGLLERDDVAEYVGAEKLELARITADAHAASFRMAVEAGVPIAMGTDMHGGEFLDELRHMNRLGLSPAQTIVSATSAAATLLRVSDEVGRIAAGLRADLVVLEGDPYDFTGWPGRIRAVLKDGELVHGTLDTTGQENDR